MTSPFPDGSYALRSQMPRSYMLRCRLCEEVTPAEPLDACRRCDGPTDVTYDWERIEETISRTRIEAGPTSIWRYGALLPTLAGNGLRAGWTPLERSDALSDLLGVELYLKLEGENPTGSYKDRIAAVAVAAALEHGFTTLCCSSTGNLGDAVAAAAAATGLEAMVLAPAGVGAGTVAARHPGAHVFAVDGTYDDCRRLELELGALFPWGFVSGNLHPHASEGAKTISFEIAEQLDWQLPDAVVCATASGMLFAKLAQGFAELTRSSLCSEPVPRLFAGQAQGSSPIADAFADARGISRVEAATDVPLARRRRPRARRARPRRSPHDGRRSVRRRRGGDRGPHGAPHRGRGHRGRLRRRRRLRSARGGDSPRRGRPRRARRARRQRARARGSTLPAATASAVSVTPDAREVLRALGLDS